MLTDSLCKSATCPSDKPHKRFSDSGGMYLEVTLAEAFIYLSPRPKLLFGASNIASKAKKKVIP